VTPGAAIGHSSTNGPHQHVAPAAVAIFARRKQPLPREAHHKMLAYSRELIPLSWTGFKRCCVIRQQVLALARMSQRFPLQPRSIFGIVSIGLRGQNRRASTMAKSAREDRNAHSTRPPTRNSREQQSVEKSRKIMTTKGRIVGALCGLALSSPLRDAAEKLLVNAGHRFPTSKTVQSFSRHLGSRLMEREGAAFERVVTFESGGQMRCGADGQIGLHCLMHYFLGTITGQMEDERPIVRLFHRLLRQGDVFFDVGTNLGFYSSYVGPLCGKTGSVHAFEANPSLIPHLERSLKLNVASSNIRLNAVAVGQQSNTVLRLYDPERIGNSSFYAHGWLNKNAWVDVPVMALDDYVQTNAIDRIDAMKIDIEGAELDGFRGMEQTFQTCPPNVIVCELMPSAVSTRAEGAARPSEIAEFLHDRGYVMCRIDEGDGRLHPPESAIAVIEHTTHIVNVAFVQPALMTERPDIFALDSSKSRTPLKPSNVKK